MEDSLRDLVISRLCEEMSIPKPEREYRFNRFRKWRFDYAWPQHKIALEIEGGVWVSGRHIRPTGFIKDIEKYNSAAVLGWKVFRATTSESSILNTIRMIGECIHGK